MEAVIKTEDEESENFVENKNLPKEIDKDYVLQNYLKTQASSVTNGSNSTVETNVETMERSREELLNEKGIPSVKDAPVPPPLEANPADEIAISQNRKPLVHTPKSLNPFAPETGDSPHARLPATRTETKPRSQTNQRLVPQYNRRRSSH